METIKRKISKNFNKKKDKKKNKKVTIEPRKEEADGGNKHESFDQAEMIRIKYDTVLREGDKIDLTGIALNERYTVHYRDHRIIIDTNYCDTANIGEIDFLEFVGLLNCVKLIMASSICLYLIKINVTLAAVGTVMLLVQTFQEWQKYTTLYNIVLENQLWIK